MIPDALNLAIANSIEPHPETAPWSIWQWPYLRSERQAWWKGNGYGPTPSDFINDPSLSFLLLKRLAEEKEEPMLDYEGGWVVFGKSLGWANSLQRHAEPGPAIAEYYARAHKIYVEEG